MRFMMIVRSETTDAKPTPELMEAMHALALQEVKAGRMIADGGLFPPAQGAKLKLGNGKVEVVDGPFAETKEVIGGFAIFELPDLDAAIASARQFLDMHVRYLPGWEGTMEVRPIAGSMVEMVKGGATLQTARA
jgi:hypothetical protein